MAKANKDGWIRHRGGKCPVDPSSIVEVQLRDGTIREGTQARPGKAWSWGHGGCVSDIMAYRIHKPEIEQSVVEIAVDGPLDWRDRIRQIDAEEAKRNEEHRQAIEALEEERLSLVQKLEGEGFKLIDKINSVLEEAKQAHEDMINPENWRAGDVIKIVSNSNDHKFEIGELVRIKRVSGECGNMTAEHLDARDWWYVDAIDARWHSRP